MDLKDRIRFTVHFRHTPISSRWSGKALADYDNTAGAKPISRGRTLGHPPSLSKLEIPLRRSTSPPELPPSARSSRHQVHGCVLLVSARRGADTAPTLSLAACPRQLRVSTDLTRKSKHGVLSAIAAATTLSVGLTACGAMRGRQVLHQKVLHMLRCNPVPCSERL